MKSNAITTASMKPILAIDAEINDTRDQIMELAIKNARHFAAKGMPSLVGDKLTHYTDIFKTTCENKYAKLCVLINPASNFPSAKIDHDHYIENKGELDEQISQKKNQNLNERFDLGNYDPQSIPQRIRIATAVTIIILFGEVLYNTKAFQVTGESFLFALAISFCVSVGVFIAAHGVPILYKEAKTALRRRTILVSTFVIAVIFFTALANMRSNYYAHQDFFINPIYFIIINMFLFLVSALLSYFVVPSLAKLKQNSLLLKKYRVVQERENEIAHLITQRKVLRKDHVEGTQQRIETVFSANYLADSMRKIYAEGAAVFKNTNIACRVDGTTPSCFSDTLPDLDIQETTIHQFNSNRKIS